MPRTAALVLQDISVEFGPLRALDGLSLEVRAGEIVALMGSHGSGKSTTLAVAAGILRPKSGFVSACGLLQTVQPAAFAANIGYVPQEIALYEDLSAEANLSFFGRMYGLTGYDLRCRVALALERMRLTEQMNERVQRFSQGVRQRVNLACAMLHDPPLLLLDEPTAFLDTPSRDALFADLHRLRDAGHALLIATDRLEEVEHCCDRLVVLHQGRVTATGRLAELVRHHPSERAVLYGHLREHLPTFFERSLRKRLGKQVELEITGRRLRLSAPTQETLGKALAMVLSDGIVLETYRTPPGRLETIARNTVGTPQGETCDAS